MAQVRTVQVFNLYSATRIASIYNLKTGGAISSFDYEYCHIGFAQGAARQYDPLSDSAGLYTITNPYGLVTECACNQCTGAASRV